MARARRTSCCGQREGLIDKCRGAKAPFLAPGTQASLTYATESNSHLFSKRSEIDDKHAGLCRAELSSEPMWLCGWTGMGACDVRKTLNYMLVAFQLRSPALALSGPSCLSFTSLTDNVYQRWR